MKETKTITPRMIKGSFVFISLIFLFSGSMFGQCHFSTARKVLQEKGKYDSLYYYGIDCSHVRINDAEKIDRSFKYSQVYPAAWIAYVEKEMPPYQFVKRSMGIGNFNYCQREIFDYSIDVNPMFITGYDNSLSLDSLKSMVRKYNLQSASGLGLVLIPETFSKPQESSFTWIVFFDIRTREVLFSCKTSGKCSHMGYTAHWASGIVRGFKRFASR